MTQPAAHQAVVLALAGYMLPSEQICIVIEDILEQAKAQDGTDRPLGLSPVIPENTVEVLKEQIAVMNAIVEAMTKFAAELRINPRAEFPDIQFASEDNDPEEKLA